MAHLLGTIVIWLVIASLTVGALALLAYSADIIKLWVLATLALVGVVGAGWWLVRTALVEPEAVVFLFVLVGGPLLAVWALNGWTSAENNARRKNERKRAKMGYTK